MAEMSGTSSGHKSCVGIGVVSVCLLILLLLLVVVGMSRLPSDKEAMYAGYWPEGDPAFIASTVLGSGYNPNVYAVYGDKRKIVGSSFLPVHKVVFQGVFALRLEPDRYVFSYSKERILKVVYKRTSLWERFAVSFEEMESTPDILSMIAEGERLINDKKEALRKECVRYKRM